MQSLCLSLCERKLTKLLSFWFTNSWCCEKFAVHSVAAEKVMRQLQWQVCRTSCLGTRTITTQAQSWPRLTWKCHSWIIFITVIDGCMRKLSPNASSRPPLLIATSLTPLPLLLLLVPLQRDPPPPACNPLNKSGFPANSRPDLSQTVGLDFSPPPPVSLLCAL